MVDDFHIQHSSNLKSEQSKFDILGKIMKKWVGQEEEIRKNRGDFSAKWREIAKEESSLKL
jgi:hypothetical protein